MSVLKQNTYQKHSSTSKMGLAIILAVLVSAAFLLYITYLTPPWNFPRSIPTIPFYATFSHFFTNYDQEDMYLKYLKEPMEKYGAVKIYFGGRWNILLSDPKYLSVIFRKEDIYAKSGNHIKIKNSVIAAYTGENVISAHGDLWKVFRSTITLGLTQFDDEPLFTNAKLFANLLESKLDLTTPLDGSLSSSTLNVQDNDFSEKDGGEQKKSSASLQTLNTPVDHKTGDVLMNDFINRLAIANIAETALGVDFGTLTSDSSELQQQLKLVKAQIFKPLFLNFPFLDNYPIPSRTRARKNVEIFRKTLLEKVQTSLLENYEYEQTQFASSSLIKAEKKQAITKQQLINNLVIILVAGHENPQLVITSLFYLFGKHLDWQQRIRTEIQNSDKTLASLEKLPLFTAFIYEALRMYPPLSQIINRRTVKKTALDINIVIPKGVYVGYNVYGTGRHTKYWENSSEFQPMRWGHTIEEISNNWKHSKQKATIGTFHGGNRACLGEKLALAEVRITFMEALMNFEWALAADWIEKMTPAGPLCPLNLKLTIKKKSNNNSTYL